MEITSVSFSLSLSFQASFTISHPFLRSHHLNLKMNGTAQANDAFALLHQVICKNEGPSGTESRSTKPISFQ